MPTRTAASRRPAPTTRTAARTPSLIVPSQAVRETIGAVVDHPSIRTINAFDEAVLLHSAVTDELVSPAARMKGDVRRYVERVQRGWDYVVERIGRMRCTDDNAERRGLAAELQREIASLLQEEEEALALLARTADTRTFAAMSSALTAARERAKAWLEQRTHGAGEH